MNIGQAQWWGWIISWEVDSCLEPAFHHCFSSVPKNPCVSVLSPSCIDGGKLQLFIVFLLLLFSCCHVWLSGIPCITAWPAFLSFTISLSFLKLMSIESVMPSNNLILCLPLLLLPSVFTSIRVFSNDSALCIRWPKYWSFSISSSNEYSGLISFRTD